MNWQTIEGSNALSAIGYDPEALKVGVQTLDGKQYFYLPVPPDVFAAFEAADSKGRFWLKTIKANKDYRCEKGDGTLTVPAPGPKPVQSAPKVIEGETVEAPVAALAIHFEAGESLVGFTPLPFDQMITRLQGQMNTFFGPLEWELHHLVQSAETITVTDAASCERAAELGKKLADQRRQITAKLRPPKQSIDQVKGVVLAKEKELVGLISAGEDHLSKAVTSYRVAEQSRAREAAAAEQARRLKEAEDARIRQAEMAQSAGKMKLADALLSTPVTAPKVEVKADVPKGAGTARVNWKWRITDATKIPLEYWLLDDVKIGQRVRADKDKTAIPGIEAYPEDSTNF